jgi:hypothetical protein
MLLAISLFELTPQSETPADRVDENSERKQLSQPTLACNLEFRLYQSK